MNNIDGKLVNCGNEHTLILSNNNEVYGVLQGIFLKQGKYFILSQILSKYYLLANF